MDEADAAVVEQLAVLVLRVDDDETALVLAEMTLDQRQRALADRAEADHYHGPIDTGVDRPFRHFRRHSCKVDIRRKGQTEGWPRENRARRPRFSAGSGGGRDGGLRDATAG